DARGLNPPSSDLAAQKRPDAADATPGLFFVCASRGLTGSVTVSAGTYVARPVRLPAAVPAPADDDSHSVLTHRPAAVAPERRRGHLVGVVPGIDLGVDIPIRRQVAAAEDRFLSGPTLIHVVLQQREHQR